MKKAKELMFDVFEMVAIFGYIGVGGLAFYLGLEDLSNWLKNLRGIKS